MNKKEFDKLVFNTYGVEADYPWIDSPEAVYRHKASRKWFAIVLSVSENKLKPIENEAKNSNSKRIIDIVNLKCPEDVFETIFLDPNIYPAYHMNKRHWISVPLDGSVSSITIEYLLSKSYEATKQKKYDD